jgi:hypothetical protein
MRIQELERAGWRLRFVARKKDRLLAGDTVREVYNLAIRERKERESKSSAEAHELGAREGI